MKYLFCWLNKTLWGLTNVIKQLLIEGVLAQNIHAVRLSQTKLKNNTTTSPALDVEFN